MAIYVEEKDHSYVVRFPYNPQMVNAIKAIPGKQFRQETKAWLIPKTSRRALERFIAQFDGSKVRAQVARPYEDPATIFPTCTTGVPQYPHQLDALRFCWNRDAVLLEIWMRLGKSRVVIDYICNKDVPRTLVVCPKSVIPVWPNECTLWAGRPICVAALQDGTAAQKQTRAQRVIDEATRRNAPAMVVMSYGALSGRSWTDTQGVTHTSDQLQEWCIDAGFDLLVLDEIQRAKAPGGKTSLYLYRLASGISTRFGLSGTPFEHSPLDAYGIYRVLDPTIFGTNFARFRERYAELEPVPGTQALRVKRDRRTGKELYKNTVELRQKVDSIRFYAGANVLKLPPVIDTVVPIQMSERAERLYHRLKEDFIAEHGDGVITASNAAVLATRLQQVTSGYIPTEVDYSDDALPTTESRQVDDAKQLALKELLEDLPHDEPVVVFCRFHADLDAVHAICEGLGRAHGELSGRRNELATWQGGATTVLVTQIDSGAVGVRLDRANRSIYYSYTWRMGNYQQSRERIRHPSKTATCFCDHLVVQLRNGRASIDEYMRRMVGNREEVIRELLAVV